MPLQRKLDKGKYSSKNILTYFHTNDYHFPFLILSMASIVPYISHSNYISICIPLLPNMPGCIIITTMIIVNVSSGGGRHVVVWARQIGGGATQLPLTLSIWDPGTLPLNPTLKIWPNCLYTTRCKSPKNGNAALSSLPCPFSDNN